MAPDFGKRSGLHNTYWNQRGKRKHKAHWMQRGKDNHDKEEKKHKVSFSDVETNDEATPISVFEARGKEN
jgi:hypothetical protein